MVKDIVKDTLFLKQKSLPATKEDKDVIVDLIDTLRANQEICVGMAANMIGVKKQILVFSVGPFIVPMVNPKIVKKSGMYQTQESCLSLEGVRPCTRYEEIEVEYLDQDFNKKSGKYSGFTAQIIQHEMQHFSGDLI
ncbi:peptide deformylase [Lachnobacterium bovis]|uniref:Peptide deformylase n=1 Tax=Lachnobacterium bovis TaxID=140626 RepID=A0A1H9SYH0_9FIRM|nr:peptide deformylase [Lachnobacterium bovis]SER89936.1 peptide deformylase [Lachnobacterium bovis]